MRKTVHGRRGPCSYSIVVLTNTLRSNRSRSREITTATARENANSLPRDEVPELEFLGQRLDQGWSQGLLKAQEGRQLALRQCLHEPRQSLATSMLEVVQHLPTALNDKPRPLAALPNASRLTSQC